MFGFNSINQINDLYSGPVLENVLEARSALHEMIEVTLPSQMLDVCQDLITVLNEETGGSQAFSDISITAKQMTESWQTYYREFVIPKLVSRIDGLPPEFSVFSKVTEAIKGQPECLEISNHLTQKKMELMALSLDSYEQKMAQAKLINGIACGVLALGFAVTSYRALNHKKNASGSSVWLWSCCCSYCRFFLSNFILVFIIFITGVVQ